MKRAFFSYLLLTVLMIPLSAYSATFNVTNEAELQVALDASAMNGQDDTINIGAGIYNAASVAGFSYVANSTAPEEAYSLTVAGPAGADLTVLDGQGTSGILDIDTTGLSDDSGVTISVSSLTFQNGYKSGTYGGGLAINAKDATISMTDSSFLANSAYDGGGLFVYANNGSGNTIDVTRCTFSSNWALQGGGALAAAGQSSMVAITNSVFTGNSSGNIGGGIEVANPFGTTTIAFNQFFNNDAYSCGAAKSSGGAWSHTSNFVNNVAAGNTAAQAGGAFCVSGSSQVIARFTGNTITGNSANGVGGGGIFTYLYLTFSSADFYNNIIRGNTAPSGNGADIYLNDDLAVTAGSVVTISNSDLGTYYSECENVGGCVPNITVTNTIDQDPLFENTTSPDPSLWDLRLQTGSPALDRGDSAAPQITATDITGAQRSLDSDGDGLVVPDMGAFELLFTRITVSPAPVDMGFVTTGSSSAPQVMSIGNTGPGDLALANITVSGTDASDFTLDAASGTCGSTTPVIASGGSCTVELAFSPSGTGSRSAVLDVTSASPADGQVGVSLAGTGLASAPFLSLSSTSLAFGNITEGYSSSPQTLTLSNDGTGYLTVSSMQLSGTNFSEFILDAASGTCGTTTPTIGVGGNCTVEVTFSPSSSGTKTASLDIVSDGGSDNVSLTGTGLSAAVNNPPSAPELVSPANGSTITADSATLGWNASTDPEGDVLNYNVFFCQGDDTFSGGCSTPVNPSPLASADDASTALAGSGIGLLLAGIALSGGLSRKRLITLLVGLIVLASLALVSCGGGGGGGGGGKHHEATPDRTYAVTDLAAGNTYYWKVTVNDGINTVESVTWHFDIQ